jgi:hypothetical protein
MQLSFAGACPALGNTSAIFGDLHIGTRNHSGTHVTGKQYHHDPRHP